MFKLKTAFSAGAMRLLAVIISACSAPATTVPQFTSAPVVQTVAVPQTVVVDKTPVIEKVITPTPGPTIAQAAPVNPQSQVCNYSRHSR